jgi:hypothetical protein
MCLTGAMADNSNIIGSKIVSSEFDAFWQQHGSFSDKQSPVLIISTPYNSGSAEEAQLHKMLQACTLAPEMYQIIQLDESQLLSWHIIRDKVNPDFVLTLGISAQQLGISALLRFNEPNRFNGCIFIPTLSLQELEKQPEAKKQLWLNALKPVFVDKTFKDQP